MFITVTVVLLLETLEVQYKHMHGTWCKGSLTTVIKAIRNTLNQGISSELCGGIFFITLLGTRELGTDGSRNIQPFSSSNLLGGDKRQKWHWAIIGDQHTEEWILKPNQNSFLAVGEFVLESSFPSFNSLWVKEFPLWLESGHLCTSVAPGASPAKGY